MGGWHPESPSRLSAIQDRLIADGLIDLLQRHEAPRAERAQLARVHSAEYIDRLFALAPQRGLVQLDPDTAMNPFSLEAALRAAGAAVLGVDLVMRGAAANAFCSVRPPGHHATRNQAMGFCLFNNVAVGAAHALDAHGLERVAIADFDVHHGNGTEDIFAAEPRVMLCSTFQHPFYPHSGAHSTGDHVVNVPLAAGTGGGGFRAEVAERWLPALESFRPQLLLVSAGFDAHRDDEMAGLTLVEADYAWVTEQLKALAQRHCGGRIVSLLEGGYELDALGRSVAAHVAVLAAL
jgi:acetoin utilization deacetylase AcuC-like enzyme